MFFFAALTVCFFATLAAMEYIYSREVREHRIEMARLEWELREVGLERDRLAKALTETQIDRDHVKVRAKVLNTIVDHYYKKPQHKVYYTETCSTAGRVTDPTWYGDDHKGTVAD